MTTPNLAKIERVPDLRATWPNEAQHFTPWLADNIAELGEALGMDLELQQTEAPVGGYSLDILATDLNGNFPVIIENQLEATDHTHLGQLVTYASGFDAGVIVWVTREFRDEHRQALDWLNQRTGEETQFFGVEVELWRIGDSLPAPHFKLAATPNGWRKETALKVSGKGSRSGSPRSEKYREYFQSLVDILRDEHGFPSVKIVRDASYRNFRTGIGGVFYSAAFTNTLGGRAKVGFNLDRSDIDWNRDSLTRLEDHKDEIEFQLGNSLDWDQVEDRRACRLELYRPGSIDDDNDTLAEIQDWMVQNLLKFKQVFDPKLVELTK